MTSIDPADRRERDRALLSEFAALPVDDPRRATLRDQIVTSHVPLVVALAGRFRDRGEPFDDIVQVGTVGLINAVDRFDLERGVEFSTFAAPTIIGEIKRHFRDRGATIRVPRRLQELRLRVNSSSEALTHQLGRSPTVREIAAHAGLSEDEVLESLESAQAYLTVSLDDGGDSSPLGELIGDEDESLDHIEIRETIRPLLDALPPRERRIVILRFFENMSQSQIAAEVGVSQMHVSRLLTRSLAQMRTALDG